MGKLRISIVEFLNTAPLVWGFTDGPLEGRYELSFTVPSLCAEALRSGQADIAIIPAIEYQPMDGMVVLPEMAVASKNEVRSLLVVAKKPIQFVKRLALDTNSRSSVALTRMLCRDLWGIAPEFVDAPADKQPAGHGCCGGDPSEHPVQGVEMLFVYDVVQQWREMTGKPSVLAVWAGRRDVVTPEVVADFLASREYGLAHLDDIAEGAALKLELPPNPLERYLRESIDFHLHAENIAALEYYYERCAEAGLIPAARPIEFAAAPQSTPHAAGAKAE